MRRGCSGRGPTCVRREPVMALVSQLHVRPAAHALTPSQHRPPPAPVSNVSPLLTVLRCARFSAVTRLPRTEQRLSPACLVMARASRGLSVYRPVTTSDKLLANRPTFARQMICKTRRRTHALKEITDPDRPGSSVQQQRSVVVYLKRERPCQCMSVPIIESCPRRRVLLQAVRGARLL